MSLSVSQGEGLTVFPITTNPKSKWPTLCHILGNLCLSPVSSTPHDLKSAMYCPTAVLGVLQILVGILNIITGILFANWGIHDYIMMIYAPFWLGALFLISAITVFLTQCSDRYIWVTLANIVNQVTGFVAVIGVALYSWDLVSTSYFSANEYSATLIQEQIKGADSILYFEESNMMFRRTLDVMMIAFAVLQLCLNSIFIVTP